MKSEESGNHDMKDRQPPIRNRLQKIIGQFFKFGIVGVSNTVIAVVIYNALLFGGIHYILAYSAAFIVSVVNAYFWNNRFVFRNAKATGRKAIFIRVFLSYGSTYLLGMAILYLLVRYAHISQQLSQILLLAITIPVNFFLNKLWAFKEKI